MIGTAGIAALLLIGAPAPAQNPRPAGTPVETAEIVCKYQKKPASRFVEKVCRTKEHWERMYQLARQQAAEEFNKSPLTSQ